MIALNNLQLPQFTAEELSVIHAQLSLTISEINTTVFNSAEEKRIDLALRDKLELINQKLHLYWNAAIKESNEETSYKAVSPAARAYKLDKNNVARFYITGSVAEGWRLHDKETDIWYSFDTHTELKQKIEKLI